MAPNTPPLAGGRRFLSVLIIPEQDRNRANGIPGAALNINFLLDIALRKLTQAWLGEQFERFRRAEVECYQRLIVAAQYLLIPQLD